MPQTLSPWSRWALLMLVTAVLAGCSARPRAPAPVEERSQGLRSLPPAAVVAPMRPSTAAVVQSQDLSPTPKPGYYTVRPGDTVIRIALETGQNWRDIVRWNGIENPNLIEVGQVLRVTAVTVPGSVEVAAVRPVTPASAMAMPPAAGEARSGSIASPAASVSRSGEVADDDVPWAWPTAGAPIVLAGFDETRNKGLDIAGKAGDPVMASADGRVVYAGAGLRGYGNLIILKHNNTYLTAYAHNQALLVKEDQSVRKGQKIAEMGNSDADRVKLHFEIRRQGKPVDPSKYLPR